MSLLPPAFPVGHEFSEQIYRSARGLPLLYFPTYITNAIRLIDLQALLTIDD